MSKRVEFIEWHETSRMRLVPDAYAFSEKRGWHWLQRVCLWILRKLRCQHYEEVVDVQRHVLHCESFMESIFRQNRSVQAVFNRKPTRLVIGSEDYEELMGSPEVRQYVALSGLDYHHGTTIQGLRLEIVPWMRGMVVLP